MILNSHVGQIGRICLADKPRRMLLNIVAIALTLLWLVRAVAAQEDVLLGPGDALSFTILGAPELSRVAVIGPDGRTQFPLAGWTNASGITVSALQDQVAQVISNRPYRVTLESSGEEWRRVAPNDLLIDVVEYRPVYISGDVRQSGELTYRPGLTMRQAIAQSGGLGALFDPSAISPLQLVELLAQRDQLIANMELEKARLDRLETDLEAVKALREVPGQPDPQGEPGADSNVRWLAARETERRLVQNNNALRLDQMRSQLETLEELARTQEINLQIEEELFARANTLVERGVTSPATLLDARRGILQATLQQLETSGEIFRLKLSMAQTEEEIEQLQAAESISLLSQIVETQGALEGQSLRLEAFDRRISMLGGQSLIGDTPSSVRIELFRTGQDAPFTFDAIEDTALMPGDVLTVTLVMNDTDATQ